MSFVYLDHNATTPVDPRVLEKMMPYFTQFYGNAASVDHEFGYQALEAVNLARGQIASAINAESDEIIFTSGATESDNIALLGVAEKYAGKGNHIITCVTEHKAVLDTCARLERLGKRVTYLPVDEYGLVDPEDVRQAITPQTILVSIMAANNEIGTLAPLAEIGRITREHGVLFHTDAAQAVGHVPLDVQAMNIDILSMSAHKVYGPKGIGALYRRRSNPRVLLQPVLFGGGHEKGVRSGTLNVPGIVGLGEAVKIAHDEMSIESLRLRRLSELLLSKLQENLEFVELNGHPVKRLSHNLSVSIKGLESRALVVLVKNLAISTGSACTSAKVEPSHVIQSLYSDERRAHSTIRLGVGRFTTDQNVLYAADEISSASHSLLEIPS